MQGVSDFDMTHQVNANYLFEIPVGRGRHFASNSGRALDALIGGWELTGIVRWTMEGARTAAHDHPLGFRDETWVLIKTIDAIEGDAVYRASALAAADWSAR